jgi:hypothetical protein
VPNKAAIGPHIVTIVSISILYVAVVAAILMIMVPALRPYIVFIDPVIAIAFYLTVYWSREVIDELTDDELLKISTIEAFVMATAMPIAALISLLTPILLIIIDNSYSLLYFTVWILTALIYLIAPD